MTTVLHRIFSDIVTLILMSPERISSRIARFCLVIASSGGNERKSGLVLVGTDFESPAGTPFRSYSRSLQYAVQRIRPKAAVPCPAFACLGGHWLARSAVGLRPAQPGCSSPSSRSRGVRCYCATSDTAPSGRWFLSTFEAIQDDAKSLGPEVVSERLNRISVDPHANSTCFGFT